MFRRYRIYLKKDLVVVYQYGKVGSTSICAAIEGAVNTHDLYGKVTCPPGFKYRFGLLYKLLFPIDRFLRRFFIRRRKEVVIVVPIRKPADRNISMFFQDLPFWYVDYFSNHKGFAKGEGVNILQDIFTVSFPHDACDSWFDDEFCRFTGVGLEDIDFDVGSGIGFAEKGKYKCLFIHHDKVGTDLGKKEIQKITGKSIAIPSVNRGERKWYNAAYRDFLSSQDYVNRYKEKMSRSRVYRKFYTV